MDNVRKILEPAASSIEERIDVVRTLKKNGISVGVFVGPVLPMKPRKLTERLATFAETVTLDKLNYSWLVKDIYRKYGWEEWLTEEKFAETVDQFKEVFGNTVAV